MPDLPRPTFDRLISEAGGIQRFRDELAAGVALQLQPVEITRDGGHPDRAILDRIADPVAREVYRRRLEAEERGWAEHDDDYDGWDEDDG